MNNQTTNSAQSAETETIAIANTGKEISIEVIKELLDTIGIAYINYKDLKRYQGTNTDLERLSMCAMDDTIVKL